MKLIEKKRITKFLDKNEFYFEEEKYMKNKLYWRRLVYYYYN